MALSISSTKVQAQALCPIKLVTQTHQLQQHFGVQLGSELIVCTAALALAKQQVAASLLKSVQNTVRACPEGAGIRCVEVSNPVCGAQVPRHRFNATWRLRRICGAMTQINPGAHKRGDISKLLLVQVTWSTRGVGSVRRIFFKFPHMPELQLSLDHVHVRARAPTSRAPAMCPVFMGEPRTHPNHPVICALMGDATNHLAWIQAGGW